MRSFYEFYAIKLENARLKQQVREVAGLMIGLFAIPRAPTRSLQAVAAMRREAVGFDQRTYGIHEEADEFWTDPDSPIYLWLQKHGVKSLVPGEIPPFTDGGAGRVYFFVQDALVVKFTRNPVEANVAMMVKGRTDTPTVIVDVLPLTDEIYGILERYVNFNVPGIVTKAADYLLEIIDNNPNMQGFPEDKASRQRMCQETIGGLGGDEPNLLHAMMLMMELINRLYRATGFFHDDAGPPNIGTYKGKVVLPDLGPNQTAKFDAQQAMDQIHANRRKLGLPPHEEV